MASSAIDSLLKAVIGEHRATLDALAAGLSGRSSGPMVGLAALLRVPSEVPVRIREMHILIGHLLCVAIEDRLGLAGADRA